MVFHVRPPQSYNRHSFSMAPELRRNRLWVVWTLVAAYVLLRLLLIPPDPSVAGRFSHDSGYISIVARNFAAGRGLVNDAYWLMFINPPTLPMAFHNANPLYIIATAQVSSWFHCTTPYAASVVSVLSNGLLGIGVFLLVWRFLPNVWPAAVAAASAMIFPPSWSDSFTVASDALATGLLFCAIAAWVWAEGPLHWLGVGLLFGLAWLTRSTATLILPGLLCWVLLRKGARYTLVAAGLAGVAALLVASPWLYHTAMVRGSPFASDSGYYWLQDYFAAVRRCTVDQYWRSMITPPGIGEVIGHDPFGLVRQTVKGIPRTLYYWAAGLADWNKPWLLLLGAALAAGMWRARAWLRSPEGAACALILLANLLSVAVRGESTEVRYYAPVNTLLAVLLVVPLFSRPGWLAIPLVAWAGLALLPQLYAVAQHARTAVPAKVEYRQMALKVAATMSPGEAVVTETPYLFTYYTHRSAISPPFPGKRELLDVMTRFRANTLLLPVASLDYFYPGSPVALSPELLPEGQVGTHFLFRRVSKL